MTDTQRLKDKRTDLRLKGMLQQLDTPLEQAAQHTLSVVTPLNLLADIALESRWHNAMHLRWRQSALTEKLTMDQFDFDHHKSRAEADHSRFKQLQHYATPDLLGCDEWGYLSLGQQGSHLFFQVISQRHQRKSTVITTHLPFVDWGKVFDSTTVATAIADRLVHNSEVLILGGTSYRRKLTYPQSRRTTDIQGACQVCPRVPNALFLSRDKRQQGTRASTCSPGLFFNRWFWPTSSPMVILCDGQSNTYERWRVW
jgi:IstB-like ATP binding protein